LLIIDYQFLRHDRQSTIFLLTNMDSPLKSSWARLFRFDWKFGMALILIFGIPRFILVLSANVTGNYSSVSILFLLMWIAPFVLLTKAGRREIGISMPRNHAWPFYAFAIGALVCTAIFLIGMLLYERSLNNWFVYIGQSYQLPAGELSATDKRIYFIIFALIGMTFSPIGEELLYRGLIHQSFVSRFGETRAAIFDSLAFGITHLAHFGIVYANETWQFLPLPALLWVIFMFLAGIIFFICKTKTSSILGAIVSHAGFNLAMTYFIFYHLL
jgi:hypothetical protein